MGSLLAFACPRVCTAWHRLDVAVPSPPGLKAFRQQLRKSTRAKGLLGLNKIKGLARQVCQPASSRASRGGLSAFHLPAQSPGAHGSGAGSREGRSLLEEVLHQQRYAPGVRHRPRAGLGTAGGLPREPLPRGLPPISPHVTSRAHVRAPGWGSCRWGLVLVGGGGSQGCSL